MANEIDGATEAANTTPELWRAVMLKGRYDRMIVGKRILSLDADISKFGDILHVPIEPSISVNDVTATTGAVTNQALTATKIDLTIDQWREVTIEVVDRANWQSNIDLLKAYQPSMAKAMAEDVDNKVFAEHSNITTNTVGATSAPYDALSDELLTSAVQKLLDGNVPLDNPNDVGFYFHTSNWPTLKKLDKFNSANVTGNSQGGSLTQKVPDIYGIPTFFSTQVASSSGVRKNLLLHKEAICWAMQRNFRMEFLSRVRKSTPLSADWLFGIKTCREEHGVVINTKA